MNPQRTIEQLLAEMKAIAAKSRAELRRTAIAVSPVRSLAADVEQAHRLAERCRRPVDAMANGHQVTVFPIGQTPPINEGPQ